ncbi:DNA replication/repair protein RecF [Fusibacter tunisiensis]|uniref:DNA replication and repair protein RecF n=1 Tax=Fusibacter tunisiensis TaxID=1008308 RepID=A0ABS2MNM5_9FIRM|nr:DNA replication/repair protein RecF [Fusibacter tunisiensis]MBM7561008.1 DNA replication and repair protein RecF [Fusibacter tunisiensis]
MKIKSVVLENFRNYDKLKQSFDPLLNIIVGDNAQGKTNLLEAIYVSGFGKSFRTNKEADLIKFGAAYASVKIECERENGALEIIEYRIKSGNKKAFLVNGVNITKISELLGRLNLILFYPDDLKLIKESPAERRRFLNRELSHISHIYCLDIIEYNRILMQRNELLKKFQHKAGFKDMVEVWDVQLAEKGARVIGKRIEFTHSLNEISSKIHANITDYQEHLKVTYVTSVKNRENYDTIKQELLEQLAQNLETDLKRGFTSVGPHRDDLDILINDINIKSYGSQGQQRTAALSLKLSEIEIVRKEIGESPILLLDDVMSELDHNRQRDLIYAFKEVQTIITTTDVLHILDDYINDSKIIQVENGKSISH